MQLSQSAFDAADSFLANALIGPDSVMNAVLDAQRAGGLPDIEVAPLSGKFLNLMVRISGAKRVLEIGTLGGYSSIWMARGLEHGGSVTTIEAEPANAAIARSNVERAGVSDRVEILLGRATDVLPTLNGRDPFDLIFIDADKESNTIYLDWAARLGRSGTIVIVDNIGREGDIVDADSPDSKVRGTRAGLEMLGADPRFDATAFQTVGVKGWDGTAIAMVV